MGDFAFFPIFSPFLSIFFGDFSDFSGREFKFSILLRRGPGLGPGGPGPGLGRGLRRRMENVFFSARVFRAVFPYIWPLAGPNIAKKGWPLLGKAKLSSRDQVGC